MNRNSDENQHSKSHDDSKILFLDASNFKDYPIGGTLTFAKQMIRAFKDQLVLVGITTDDDIPVGKWIKKEIDNTVFDFFAIRRTSPGFRRPLIPDRLKNFLAYLRYKKQIKSYPGDIRNVFIQLVEILIVVERWKYANICFRFPGLTNALAVSRYPCVKYFSKISQKLIYAGLTKTNLVLASADKKAITDFVARSNPKIEKERIVQFQTRMNTRIFKKKNKSDCRSFLGLDHDSLIVVSTGRLAEYKGWKFMISSFNDFKKEMGGGYFFILGDGEDKEKARSYTKKLGLEKAVSITGALSPERVSDYLNASDLFIMGSYFEGWATSLMEAIACGKPVCVTDFPSSEDMVEDGKNGFVVRNRNKEEFVNKMIMALSLPDEELERKSELFSKYSHDNLREDILQTWQLF